MLAFRLELKFICPLKDDCRRDRNLCDDKMKVVIFKQDETEPQYSWLFLNPFCDQELTREKVVQLLAEHFKYQIKELSVKKEKPREVEKNELDRGN